MKHRLLLAAVAGAVLVTACGDDSTSTSEPTAATSASPAATLAAAAFPVSITNAGTTVTIKEKPTKIVSLSPTHTETLFAIGAGPQVIAVDNQSNYPANVPKTDLSGFKPNIEAIAAKKPDLVVVSDDLNNVVAGLRALSIPVLLEPAAQTFDDAYAEINELGKATGNAAGAAKTVSDMKARIDAATKSAPKPVKALTVYHELDDGLYSVTSSTFIGSVYKLAGLENVADAAPNASSGYPQLSAEYIVKANPDIIALADVKCCAQNAGTVAARPGFKDLSAVKNGAVVELDDDIASRWGPRTPELLETVLKAVTKLAGTSSSAAS
ncbi:MAG: ABC transporter substrate-binding protein [Acidimicrobiia bacterium]